MFSKVLASAAFATVALASIGSANAMPSFNSGLPAAAKTSGIEQVDYRRVCDRDGDRCHSVWIDRDHDRYGRWGWHRVCDRDGDRCRWVRGWR